MGYYKSHGWKTIVLVSMLLTVSCSSAPDTARPVNKNPTTMSTLAGEVAFVHRDEKSFIENIYVINMDGSELRSLVAGMQNTINPDWSPDGRRIVFSALTGGINQIYTIKSDGSDLTQLTFGKYSSYNPVWSRNGKYILFLSQFDDSVGENGRPLQQAYIMNSDGSEQRRFTNEHRFVTAISWYKDSNLISVSVVETRYKLRTYIVDLDDVIQNEYPEIILDGIPIWSSDGKTIVFTPFVIRADCSGIVILRSNSFEQKCLMQESLAPPVVSKTPSWSPNDQYIIFSSNRDGDYDLYTVKVDGSELTQLTNIPGDEMSPVWSP
jgi:TolB protein